MGISTWAISCYRKLWQFKTKKPPKIPNKIRDLHITALGISLPRFTGLVYLLSIPNDLQWRAWFLAGVGGGVPSLHWKRTNRVMSVVTVTAIRWNWKGVFPLWPHQSLSKVKYSIKQKNGLQSFAGHAFTANFVMYTHHQKRWRIKLDVSLICFVIYKNVLLHKKLAFAFREQVAGENRRRKETHFSFLSCSFLISYHLWITHSKM